MVDMCWYRMENKFKFIGCMVALAIPIMLNSPKAYAVSVKDVDPIAVSQSTSVKQVMTQLYPSGLRLPTTAITALDLAAGDLLLSESSDAYDVVELLNTVIKGEMYTSAEVSAMDAYYDLMKLKSVAIGLPEYYVQTPIERSDLDSVKAKEVIAKYEQKFGVVLFIEGKWSESMQRKGYDMSQLLYSNEKISYCYPTGSMLQVIYKETYDDRLEYFKGQLKPYGDSIEPPTIDPYQPIGMLDTPYDTANRLLATDMEECFIGLSKGSAKPTPLVTPNKDTPAMLSSNPVVSNNSSSSDIYDKVDRFSLRDVYTKVCAFIVVALMLVGFVVDYIRRKRDVYYQITKHLR